jgi:predicted nucleic acid-binding protein
MPAEEDGLLAEAESQTFLKHLGQMPIVTDPATVKAAFDNTVHLARRYRLSAYDAAYLELAIREEVALATLDGELRKAATKAGVQLFEH